MFNCRDFQLHTCVHAISLPYLDLNKSSIALFSKMKHTGLAKLSFAAFSRPYWSRMHHSFQHATLYKACDLLALALQTLSRLKSQQHTTILTSDSAASSIFFPTWQQTDVAGTAPPSQKTVLNKCCSAQAESLFKSAPSTQILACMSHLVPPSVEEYQ